MSRVDKFDLSGHNEEFIGQIQSEGTHGVDIGFGSRRTVW